MPRNKTALDRMAKDTVSLLIEAERNRERLTYAQAADKVILANGITSHKVKVAVRKGIVEKLGLLKGVPKPYVDTPERPSLPSVSGGVPAVCAEIIAEHFGSWLKARYRTRSEYNRMVRDLAQFISPDELMPSVRGIIYVNGLNFTKLTREVFGFMESYREDVDPKDFPDIFEIEHEIRRMWAKKGGKTNREGSRRKRSQAKKEAEQTPERDLRERQGSLF